MGPITHSYNRWIIRKLSNWMTSCVFSSPPDGASCPRICRGIRPRSGDLESRFALLGWARICIWRRMRSGMMKSDTVGFNSVFWVSTEPPKAHGKAPAIALQDGMWPERSECSAGVSRTWEKNSTLGVATLLLDALYIFPINCSSMRSRRSCTGIRQSRARHLAWREMSNPNSKWDLMKKQHDTT